MPKVYLSKVYICEMYPTCVSSKLCEFFLLQIPELISRHVWAISRNFNQFRGPPQLEEGEEEEEEKEEKHVVTLQMDLHKKT